MAALHRTAAGSHHPRLAPDAGSDDPGRARGGLRRPDRLRRHRRHRTARSGRHAAGGPHARRRHPCAGGRAGHPRPVPYPSRLGAGARARTAGPVGLGPGPRPSASRRSLERHRRPRRRRRHGRSQLVGLPLARLPDRSDLARPGSGHDLRRGDLRHLCPRGAPAQLHPRRFRPLPLPRDGAPHLNRSRRAGTGRSGARDDRALLRHPGLLPHLGRHDAPADHPLPDRLPDADVRPADRAQGDDRQVHRRRHPGLLERAAR